MKKAFLINLIAITAIGCSKKQSSAPATSGIITTFAGNGTYGYSGDGGLATAAELNEPVNIAIDNSGNVYIVDGENHLVRKVNTNGIISTFAGSTAFYPGIGDNGPATNVSFIPNGIAVDNSGNVYVTDGENARIRKINSSGIISTFAGSGIQGYTGDGGQATDAEFNLPYSIATDNSGNIYVSDKVNNCVRKIGTNGIISTVAGNGIGGYTGDGGPATAAEITAADVAVDNSGNIYISDGLSCIRKVNSLGIIATIAGNNTKGFTGDGGQATSAELNEPFGIAVDNSGNIYLSDNYNKRVRKINSSGVITTFAGGGTFSLGDGHTASSAELMSPRGLAIDNTGNVFIADLGSGRIRKVSK